MLTIKDILQDKINKHQSSISQWLKVQSAANPPELYNSIDFRHSGFKISPVDANSFPAGFNNFSPDSIVKGQELFKKYLNIHFPQAEKILIIPENHTRNIKYLHNLQSLKQIFTIEGVDVRVGSFLQEEQVREIKLEKNILTLEKITITDNRLITSSGFDADLIIVNNDFTKRPEKFWSQLKQPVIPSLKFGWFNRSKTHHFIQYQKLITEFSQIINIDPWLLSSFFDKAENIDFKSSNKLHDLEYKISNVLTQISAKYQQYDIKQQPYCYIKADNGTYGMGIMQIYEAQEVLNLNKKNRNKMNIIKDKTKNTSLIIQEGVRTIDNFRDAPAEYMSYCINGQVVSTIYRFNQNRNLENNLNAKGMEFLEVKDYDFSLKNIISTISQISCLACSKEEL